MSSSTPCITDPTPRGGVPRRKMGPSFRWDERGAGMRRKITHPRIPAFAGMTLESKPFGTAGVWISFSRFGRLLIDFESINAELRPGNGGIRPHLPLKVLFDFPTHVVNRLLF